METEEQAKIKTDTVTDRYRVRRETEIEQDKGAGT